MWNSDGSLTIWSSSQGHFTVRDQTARLMNIPVSKVKAIPMEIGGGFGGKTLVYVEPVAAALARETGRPVKVTMSRTEVFEASFFLMIRRTPRSTLVPYTTLHHL